MHPLPLLALVVLLVGACAAPAGPEPAAAPPGRQAAFPPGPPPPPMPDPEPVTRATSGTPALVGPIWAWQGTLMNDDSRVVPESPERYTLQLQPDGKAVVRADCNRGSGTYARDGQRLAFGAIAQTRMACPPESRDAAFLKGLANVASYLFDGDVLVLELKYDSGAMRFRALAP